MTRRVLSSSSRFLKNMKFYRSENVYCLLILRGFKTSGTFKNVAGDHIYHLAKYGLMGSDPDRFYERYFFEQKVVI